MDECEQCDGRADEIIDHEPGCLPKVARTLAVLAAGVALVLVVMAQ